jgi:hypothetical protein
MKKLLYWKPKINQFSDNIFYQIVFEVRTLNKDISTIQVISNTLEKQLNNIDGVEAVKGFGYK